MKTVLPLFLALCMLFSLGPAAFAEGEDYDSLTKWNVRITVPENATAVLQGNEYYIYTQQENSIPYVMLRTYRADDAVSFLNQLTAFMQEQYPDLKVTADIARKTFGERKCFEIDYRYQISGYEVLDRRPRLILRPRLRPILNRRLRLILNPRLRLTLRPRPRLTLNPQRRLILRPRSQLRKQPRPIVLRNLLLKSPLPQRRKPTVQWRKSWTLRHPEKLLDLLSLRNPNRTSLKEPRN